MAPPGHWLAWQLAGIRGLALAAATVAGAACSSADAPATTALPGVIYAFPGNAQVDVPLGTRIMVAFSVPVDKAVLAACTGSATDVTGALCLVGPDGPVAATPELIGDGSTVQLTGLALAAGTTYELRVTAALAPGAVNLPATGPLARFTTRSERTRVAAPALVAVNGAPPASPDAFRPMFETSTIRLVFSEPLDARTAVLAPGAIELVDPAGAAVPASLLTDGIHVSIDPAADLIAGTAYTLKLGSQLTDLAGQPIAPVTVTLTPQHTGSDHPIPQLLRTRQPEDPGPAVTFAGDDRNITAIASPLLGAVSSQMQPSVLAAELGDPALGGPLAFTIRRGQRLRMHGLDVQLGGGVPAGLATGDIVIELVSDGGGRIYRNPHQAADQIPDNTRAPLVTDLSMDLAVYAIDATGNAVLTQTVLGVQGSGVVLATGGVLDIEAVIALDLGLLGVSEASTNLVLELITDPAATPDADTTPPGLLAALPSATASEAPLPLDGVELVFSEPIDLDRARAGGIQLQTAAGAAIASVIESHGAAVTVRPAASLAAATSYQVVLGDVADLAGNLLAAVPPVAFSTPALLATTMPLSIASIHPGVPCALVGGTPASPGRCLGGAGTDDGYHAFTLAADEPIDVRFTQPPRPATVVLGAACGAGSVRVEQLDDGGACKAVVAGTLRLDDRALRFVPDVPWRAGTHYRLTLISGTGTGAGCTANAICGSNSVAPSFAAIDRDAANNTVRANLVVEFQGAAPTGATLAITQTAPFSDLNGSGMVETGEAAADANRVALRITGTSGVIESASFPVPDCDPATPEAEACMYLSGAMPVELLPLAHDCPLPGGGTAASCVPVALSPQLMFATSLPLHAKAVIVAAMITIDTTTGMLVLRVREPATGPITGYLIDDGGTPTLVVGLDVYLDAPDMQLPLLTHDLHSKPLSLILRGPLRFLPDGRIAIAVANVADVPMKINVSGPAVSGAVNMVIPKGEMKLQLVSPPLRGGLP